MPIEKGFIIFPRVFYSNELAEKPPHFREIWFWLLKEANHSDQKINGNIIKRGQLYTSYDKIIDGLKWYVGRKKYTYKKHQVERAFKHFSAAARLTTQQATRGMVVTICNYDYYQTADNYTGHSSGHNKKGNEATTRPQDKQELKNERMKESVCIVPHTSIFSKIEVQEIFSQRENELYKKGKSGAWELFYSTQEKNQWKFNGKLITAIDVLIKHIDNWIIKDDLELKEKETKNTKQEKKYNYANQ